MEGTIKPGREVSQQDFPQAGWASHRVPPPISPTTSSLFPFWGWVPKVPSDRGCWWHWLQFLTCTQGLAPVRKEEEWKKKKKVLEMVTKV